MSPLDEVSNPRRLNPHERTTVGDWEIGKVSYRTLKHLACASRCSCRRVAAAPGAPITWFVVQRAGCSEPESLDVLRKYNQRIVQILKRRHRCSCPHRDDTHRWVVDSQMQNSVRPSAAEQRSLGHRKANQTYMSR